MNERIKELASQCWDLRLDGRHFDQEQFAELIVRECINKITTYDLVPGHSAKWEDIYDIHTRLLQDLGEELKEHFGVEE
jgi:hypothetical protein